MSTYQLAVKPTGVAVEFVIETSMPDCQSSICVAPQFEHSALTPLGALLPFVPDNGMDVDELVTVTQARGTTEETEEQRRRQRRRQETEETEETGGDRGDRGDGGDGRDPAMGKPTSNDNSLHGYPQLLGGNYSIVREAT